MRRNSGSLLAAILFAATAPIAMAQTPTIDKKSGEAQPVKAQPASPNELQPGMAPEAKHAVPTQPTSALPEALKLSTMKHDWGDIPDTNPAEFTFDFTNVSDKEITLAVAASCGCTVPTMEKTVYKPGENGKVTARFDPHGRTGPQTKTLTFTIVNPQGVFAQQIATLTANVRALVLFDPPKMFLNEVDHIDGQVTKLNVNGRKEGFKVLSVTSNSEFVKATIGEPTTIDQAGDKLTSYPIELNVGKGAPIGTLQTQLEITTNDERAKLGPYFLGADVVGDIKSTPAQAIIRANEPGVAFTTQFRIDTRSGSAFNILSVSVDAKKEMQTVADVSRENDGKAYLVTLNGVTPLEPGMVQGTVVLETDARGGESLRVPFTAVIRRPVQGNQMQPPVPVPGNIQRVDPNFKK